MKVNSINISQSRKLVKAFSSLTVAGLCAFAPVIRSNASIVNAKPDTFELSQTHEMIFIDEPAPSPIIKIAGKEVKANIVVDLSENKLYHYDNEGKIIKSYNVASGKSSTPTHTGIRVISAVEKYPYNSAPVTTKRYNKPDDYGPRVLYLETIDPRTGKNLGSNGEFIHGTNNPESIGKHVSKGCIRMLNSDVKELASKVKRGQYVLIKE